MLLFLAQQFAASNNKLLHKNKYYVYATSSWNAPSNMLKKHSVPTLDLLFETRLTVLLT